MVAGCLLLVACSGGKSQAGLSSDLVRRGNSVCDGWTKALNQLGFSPPLADSNRMVPFTRDQLAIDRSYTDQFKALSATTSERSALGPVYAAFDSINSAEAGVLTAAQAGDRVAIQTYHQRAVDQTAQITPTLKNLGLTVCAI